MKKNVLTFLMCLTAFVFTSNSFAQKETADVLKVPEGCITLDGDIDDWRDVQAIDFLGFWGDKGPEGGTSDLSGTFKLLWSDQGIYLMVDIVDESISPKQEGWYDWDADQVEIYFEPTGAAAPGTTYSEVLASQIRYSPGTTDVNADTLVLTGDNLKDVEGDNWGDIKTVDSKIGEYFDDGFGYTAEIFIHFNDINPDGVNNVSNVWGFTVTVSDGDDGDKRNCTMIWEMGEDGEPYHSSDAGSFGIINLTDTQLECENGVNNFAAKNTVEVYPNPATETLTIRDYQGSVNIYSVLGKKVMEQDFVSESIDISNLTSGLYLLETEKGRSKFLKK